MSSARPARPEEAGEVIRLASIMYEAMGLDPSHPEWRASAERMIRDRTGSDDCDVRNVELHATPEGAPLYRSYGFAGPRYPQLRAGLEG